MPKKINTPPVDGVICARYSDRGQNELSIEEQVAECQAYAAANNIRITAIYADKAISGKTDKRPEFQKMIRHAEKELFDVIVAWKSNRLGRNMEQALHYESKLSSFGVKCCYVKEDYGDNAAGRFALRSMMNVNQFMSESMSEDVKRAMLHRAQNEQKAFGTAPYGYKRSKDGRWEIDKTRAKIVQEIFNRIANGEQFVQIIRDFNSRGLKTSQGNDWNKDSFKKIIGNERYAGVYIYDTVRIEGGMPAIVEKELFLRVQEHLGSRQVKKRHRSDGEYLLTGKLYCGKCKEMMVGVSGTGKSKIVHHYYKCKGNLRKCCDKSSVRRDWLEKEVATAIQNLLMDDDILQKIVDSIITYGKLYKEKSDIGFLEKQLKEKKRALVNVLDAIEQGLLTDAVKERAIELEKEQKRLQNLLLLEHSEIFDVSKDDILLLFASLRHGDVGDREYQAKLFDNVIIAVYLYDKHFDIEFNFTGKKKKHKVPFATVNGIDKEGASECSYKLDPSVPRASQARL
jgi:DNA invertase Pin-like site-specific DNA recombinase